MRAQIARFEKMTEEDQLRFIGEAVERVVDSPKETRREFANCIIDELPPLALVQFRDILTLWQADQNPNSAYRVFPKRSKKQK